MYGESPTSNADTTVMTGLSPRVRGILEGVQAFGRRAGSIPACTGNPGAHKPASRSITVYPRVYGESSSPSCPHACSMGLSPRVRGILVVLVCLRLDNGSIPACTGNPLCQNDPLYQMSKNDTPAYGDSPAMRRINCHTSRASGNARCRGAGTSMDSTSQTVASEA